LFSSHGHFGSAVSLSSRLIDAEAHRCGEMAIRPAEPSSTALFFLMMPGSLHSSDTAIHGSLWFLDVIEYFINADCLFGGFIIVKRDSSLH
jgi:hypothetical protein